MKRLVVLLFAALFLIGCCAEMSVGMPNPMTEYDSLAELNEAAGTFLCRPAVMGVTDEVFFTIACNEYTIAEYRFSINGYACNFRCAPTTEDISGIYINAEPAFNKEFDGEIQYVDGEGMHIARWFDINGQYCFALEDPDGLMDAETFHLICDELKDITNPGMNEAETAAYFEELSGEYEDAYSLRAHATVTADGTGACVEVYWANSAFEYVKWTMNIVLGEDGLLYYNDCICEQINTDEDGNDTTQILYEDGEGYFSEVDGTLYWNGAEDPDCTECTFEPVLF